MGGKRVAFDAFPSLLADHLAIVADTDTIEDSATRLRSSGFPEEDLLEVIRAVCRWGGWAGVAGRVRRDNTKGFIRDAFFSAEDSLFAPTPSPVEALRSINRIKGLGKPSYASKHLRFLRPELCPILDKMFAEDLGYRYDVDGYGALTEDLSKLARALEARKIDNPRNRPVGRWFAGDLDMALFAWVRRYRGQWS